VKKLYPWERLSQPEIYASGGDTNHVCLCSCCHVCCRSVLIIDDSQKDSEKKIVMELTFVQPVMSVRLRMDRYRIINVDETGKC